MKTEAVLEKFLSISETKSAFLGQKQLYPIAMVKYTAIRTFLIFLKQIQ